MRSTPVPVASAAVECGPAGSPARWLRWPVPALLVWSACFAVFGLLQALQVPLPVAAGVSLACGALGSLAGSTPWRRIFIAAGVPLTLAGAGVGTALPGWAWLLPLLVLLTIYPLRTWGDAPLLPTPRGALQGLARLAPLREQARVLDAGCGLGAGLRELHRTYPLARIEGIEWSRPLAALCALRCRYAAVCRGDLWAADWSGYQLVYLFQRPESMARAVEKAARELPAGAWLASLAFEAPMLRPTARHRCPDGRLVWLYRAPFRRR